jgi:MFS family permease
VAVWGLGFGAVPVAAQSWMAQAMPANVEGGLALFVSALQGSLAAGSAVGGIVYDTAGPSGALIVAAVIAALGALSLLSRAGAAISSSPAGSVDLVRARDREAPAPPHGASMKQETAHNQHADVAVRGHTQAAPRKELLCPTRL